MCEQLEVATKVYDQKSYEKQTGEAHDVFLAKRRGKEPYDPIHRDKNVAELQCIQHKASIVNPIRLFADFI
jgi:hypothetical protein